MIRTAAALALIGFLVCAGCATTGARQDRKVVRHGDPVHTGVAYLVDSQNEDGSWGTFASARPWQVMTGTVASFRAWGDASTALCVMALIEPSKVDANADTALHKGMEYLLNAPEVGRATGEVFYDTWTHVYLLQCVAALLKDGRFEAHRTRLREVGQREVIALRRHRGAEGGWGYYDFGWNLSTPSGFQSTSFLTGAAVVALLDAKSAGLQVPDALINDGVRCLERLRQPNGAFAYATNSRYYPGVPFNQVQGSLGRSQPCNLALHLKGANGVDEAWLKRGLKNLKDYHHFIWIGRARPYPHEAFYSTAGYYFFFGHYYASRILEHLPRKDAAEWATWLEEEMAELRDPDGSWFDYPLYGYYKAYGTAYALLIIQNCREAKFKAVAFPRHSAN